MTRRFSFSAALVAVAALAVAGCGKSSKPAEPVSHAVGDTVPYVLVTAGPDGKSVSRDMSVTVASITKGRIVDLGGFSLGSDAKSTPYYVRMTFENTGKQHITSFPQNLGAELNNGEAATHALLGGAFRKCHSPAIKGIAPGRSVTGCAVYLAPPGTRVTAVKGYSKGNALQIWK